MAATLVATLFTALATGAGAIPILLTRGISDQKTSAALMASISRVIYSAQR